MAKILYLVHSLPPEEHTGTPLFAYGYARAMAARGHQVIVVYPSVYTTSWELAPERLPDEDFDRVVVPSTSFTGPFWSIEAASSDPTTSPTPVAAFLQLLRRVKPDVVHVVNNVNLPLDFPELAKVEGIPVVRSVTCAEDLCGLIAPVSPRSGRRGYCSAPLTPEHCARCVATVFADSGNGAGPAPANGARARTAALDREYQQLVTKLTRKRARTAEQYLRVFERTIFATAAFRHYFEQTIPLDPAGVRVIEMGLDPAPRHPLSAEMTSILSEALPAEEGTSASRVKPVMFCLAATLDPAKGIDTLVEAFTDPRLRDRDDYRLCLLGGGNEDLVAGLVDTNPNVIMVGAYEPEELPALLAQMQVGLSTSGFETFHRVTREYLLAGIPVIGSRAFGIPDIVRPGKNGLLFDSTDPDSLVRAVLSLLDDHPLLAELTEGARTTPVRSCDEEADDLAALYAELLAGSPVAPVPGGLGSVPAGAHP
ncbi:MAG TPA: glycosyltransferase family 4 protein [Acidimicrobiales bacterium]|jgi:glycosyltransferase involved in cell wall biosynthesis